MMPHTFDSVLSNDLIEVIDRNDEMGSFAIKLGSLETPIFIELGRFMTTDTVKFDVSHAIKTPLQLSAYQTGRTFEDDAGSALYRAIKGLTQYYREAVAKGLEPDESWLVEN